MPKWPRWRARHMACPGYPRVDGDENALEAAGQISHGGGSECVGNLINQSFGGEKLAAATRQKPAQIERAQPIEPDNARACSSVKATNQRELFPPSVGAASVIDTIMNAGAKTIGEVFVGDDRREGAPDRCFDARALSAAAKDKSLRANANFTGRQRFRSRHV
jgi:hypothetical protein